MGCRVHHALEAGLQAASGGWQGYPDTRRADLADQRQPGCEGEERVEWRPARRAADCYRRQPAAALGGRERRGKHHRTGPERAVSRQSSVLALRGRGIPGKTGRNRHTVILAAAILTVTGPARRCSPQARCKISRGLGWGREHTPRSSPGRPDPSVVSGRRTASARSVCDHQLVRGLPSRLLSDQACA